MMRRRLFLFLLVLLAAVMGGFALVAAADYRNLQCSAEMDLANSNCSDAIKVMLIGAVTVLTVLCIFAWQRRRPRDA